MSRNRIGVGGAILAFGALAVAVALVALVSQRLARGDQYPAGSSYSSAPEGTRALAEGLRATQVAVVRATRLADSRTCVAGCTLLSLRWSLTAQSSLEPGNPPPMTREKSRLEERLRSGARVVVAFVPLADGGLERKGIAWETIGWERRPEGVFFTELPATALPIRSIGPLAPTVVSLPVGAGTLVLVADGTFLENRALRESRDTALIHEVLGLGESPRLLVFEETHLGVAESGGPMVLARRYGLLGGFLGLLVLAALAVWQALSPIAPRRSATPDEAGDDGIPVTDGLVALYRRGLPTAQLLPECLEAYRHFGARLEPEAWVELERMIPRGRAAANPAIVVEAYEKLRRKIATLEGRSSE